MPFAFRPKLVGIEPLIKKLDGLKGAVRNKIIRDAFKPVARGIKDSAKQRVRVDTGWLRKSLDVRIQTYRNSGITVAVIGPRTGFQKDKKTGKKVLTTYGKKMVASIARRPTQYAHLVELGHATSGGGKVQAYPFLEPAWKANEQWALNMLKQRILAGLEAAAAKRGA
jgi:HK97 gp10 family phage protein